MVTKLSYEDPKNKSVFSNLSDLCEQIETLQVFLVFDSMTLVWTIALNKLTCRKRHKPKLFSANCPENVTSILRFSWNLGDRLDQAQSTPLHDPTHWRKVNTVDEQRHQLN